MKPQIILVGSGGHCRSCIDVIEQEGRFEIAGLVGVHEEMHTQQFGYEVIATDDDLPQLAKAYPYALIAVGQTQTSVHRIHLYQQASKLGFQFPAIIAPSAQVSQHAKVGAGSIVMHRAIINAGATVGSNCIINTHALIEHDVAVADHCHISTGAILNGDVKVGVGCFVGSGSTIKQGLTIGQLCVVGMGLSVRHNLATKTQFLGHNKP